MARVPEKVLNWLYSVLTSVFTAFDLPNFNANLLQRNTKTSIGLITTQPRPCPTTHLSPHARRSTVRHLYTRHSSLRTFGQLLTAPAYENGTSALLLTLSGTLPVTFRGATYGFPIAIWVPYAYPREPPIVYITPSQDMAVRPGQHVSGDGRVYHPYLAQWAQYWDVCLLCAAQYFCSRNQSKAMRR